jgi:hypothetical protein
MNPRSAAAALAYARRGWAVIPCHAVTPAGGCTCGAPACGSPAKHPRTARGLHDASTRTAVIKRWWQRWPTANVGIRTGAVSGLVVLDVDPPHGGNQSLRALVAANEALPATVTVRTGSGGLHLYFAHPGGSVHNSSSALGAGIDVRGDGGYVIAPPSLHVAGQPYQWTASARLARLPGWLQTLMQPPDPARIPPGAPPRVDSDASAWARAALEAEITNIATAVEGQRNHTLNRASFALGQIVAGGHLDKGDVISSLEAAGFNAGLGANETRRTIVSGLRAGQQHPRHPTNRRPQAPAAPSAATPGSCPAVDLRTIELGTAEPTPGKHARPPFDVALDIPSLP